MEATSEAIRVEAADAIKMAKTVVETRVRECYEDVQLGLVLCEICFAADTESGLSKRKQWYGQKGAVVKIQCEASWKYL